MRVPCNEFLKLIQRFLQYPYPSQWQRNLTYNYAGLLGNMLDHNYHGLNFDTGNLLAVLHIMFAINYREVGQNKLVVFWIHWNSDQTTDWLVTTGGVTSQSVLYLGGWSQSMTLNMFEHREKLMTHDGNPKASSFIDYPCPIGSMYAIYGNIYHQYTSFMLAYIPYMDPMDVLVHVFFIDDPWDFLLKQNRPSWNESEKIAVPKPQFLGAKWWLVVCDVGRWTYQINGFGSKWRTPKSHGWLMIKNIL